MLAASPRDRGPSAPSLRIVTSVSVVMPRPLSTQISCALYWSASPDTPLNKTGFPSWGGRPIRAKTYASVLDAMLWGALARIGTGSGDGGGGLGCQAGAAAGRLEVAAARDNVRVGERRDAGEVLIADVVAGVT